MNNMKTFILMAGLMGLFLIAGQLLGGSQGLILAALVGFAFNFGMYFFSDRLVLRMYGAQVVTATTACDGLRPVANALGCSWGATATTGMGRPAR